MKRRTPSHYKENKSFQYLKDWKENTRICGGENNSDKNHKPNKSKSNNRYGLDWIGIGLKPTKIENQNCKPN